MPFGARESARGGIATLASTPSGANPSSVHDVVTRDLAPGVIAAAVLSGDRPLSFEEVIAGLRDDPDDRVA